MIIALVVAGALTAITLNVAAGRRRTHRLEATLTAGSCRLDHRSDPGRAHIANARYQVDPPSGGDHDPTPATAGFYTADNAPPLSQVVHALEHGYITLWYRSDLGGSKLDQLRSLSDDFPRDVLVVPRDTMSVPVAATAWHQRLLCAQVEPTRFADFVKGYRNKGPERVPH